MVPPPQSQREILGCKGAWQTLVGIGVMVTILLAAIIGLIVWINQLEDVDRRTYNRKFGFYEKAGVSCDAPYCAEIASSMMAEGGTVADAAIAGLVCMGVVHSQSLGISGGFFAVLFNSTTKEATMLDARETAPAFATPNMFSGDSNKSQIGGLAVAIPGEVRGYWELWQRHGRLPWKKLFTPTIELARKGFEVTDHTAMALQREWEVIKNEPSMTEIFVNPKTGKHFVSGDIMKREKLADTLELIAEHNVEEFYEGQVGKWFVDDLREFGGNITMEDMKNYRVEWLDPLKFSIHKNFTLLASPPTGSGLLMGFIMKVLSGYRMNPGSIATTEDTIITYQRIIEAFKHAFAYRSLLGDPTDESIAEAVKELIGKLSSDTFAEEIRQKITARQNQTSNAPEDYGAEFHTKDDYGTAHISVVGPGGDGISITSTINTYFGARIRSKNTGIIYNNEMDDFSAPGITNYFGVPPSPNNFIKPGKRPMSSMTPAIFVDGEGKLSLVTGTAGGTKIITATTLTSIRKLWFEEDITKAVDEPRFHHQLMPMTLDLGDGFSKEIENGLKALGHEIKTSSLRSAVNGVSVEPNGKVVAKMDGRKPGSVAGF